MRAMSRHSYSLLLVSAVAVLAVPIGVSCNAGVGNKDSTSNGGNIASTNQTGTGSNTGGSSTGTDNGSSTSTGFGTGSGLPGCMGLQCSAQMDACETKGMSPTTISGRIYDPAGAVPLYNVYVYIPNTTPDPIMAGNPTCTQCEAPASGHPVIGALTNSTGHFTLQKTAMDTYGVPSGANIPLVIQVGKWRRQVTIPMVNPCQANNLPDPAIPKNKLRLPAKTSEGDMPLIAFTSGCDPAECFLRHIGIDDSEFVKPGNPTGHVHFYTGQGGGASVAGGNTWQETYLWWSKLQNLQKYDIVFNACECSDYDRNANAQGGDAYQAMHDYIDGGGRVFSTHYYYNWFAPPTGKVDYQGVANWALPEGGVQPYTNFYIDSSFPKGKAFADWLFFQNFTPTYGQITLTDTRYDMNAVTSEASRWIFNADSQLGPYATMYMTFNAPIAKPAAMQCGRAVYSDVHLSGSSFGGTFPSECANADPGGSHKANEEALEFLFFDLSSCVQDNTMPPPPPPPM